MKYFKVLGRIQLIAVRGKWIKVNNLNHFATDAQNVI
jgi:hypothetical protein